MNDLSSALERLQVAFATPTPGLGAPGPAEEGDRDMGDADGTERATPPEEAQTPPTKRLKGFVAASQKATSQANKPVTLVPVDGKPGYFKLVDLPDLFPVLPASAATLLRDITVEEAVSLFYKFVGKNLTEDLVIRILERVISSSRDLGAIGPVSGGGEMSSLLGSVFTLLFHLGGARGFFRLHGSGATSRQLGLLDHEATCVSCPKDGPSQPRFGKSGCGRLTAALRSP